MLRTSVLGIGACVSIGAFALLGCGDEKSESPSGTPPAPTVEKPAAPAVVDELWTTKLPEDFPQDMPRYPAAEVVKANSTPATGLKATFSTTDDAGKVAAFFSDSLAAQGWSTQRVDGPGGTLVLADKGARSATVGVTTAAGKTQIDLLVIEMR